MTLLLGHRGAPFRARENTLESFQKALEAGLDGFELDLQMTQDGVLVVHHDPDLEGKPIAQTLRQDLPPWVPDLESVLQAFPQAFINIELKSQPPHTDGREEALARLLARYGRPGIWVSSFDPLALLRLRRLGVRPLGLLYTDPLLLDLAPCLEVEWVHPWEGLLDEATVQALRTRYKVLAWTVNDPGRARALKAWGVEALVGDDPEALRV